MVMQFCVFFTVGRHNTQLKFSQPFPAYITTTATCCSTRYGFTLTMWLSLNVLPANLVRLKQNSNLDVALSISVNGDIKFSIKGETARLVPGYVFNQFYTMFNLKTGAKIRAGALSARLISFYIIRR